MDYESQQILQKYLQADEKILWFGKPAGGIRFRAADAFLIPFFVIWAGFSFVWEFLAVWGGAPFFFALFGIPFVVIGFHMLIGRFFQDARIRSKTIYGITNKRAIIAYEGKIKKVKSWDFPKMTIETKRKNDGAGTISFGKDHSKNSSGITMPFMEPVLFPEFFLIDDVDRVEGILKQAKSDYDQTGGSFWNEGFENTEENQSGESTFDSEITE